MNIPAPGFIPMEWTSWAQGFTDLVFSNNRGQSAKLDNLVVDQNGKPVSRFGSTLFYPSHPQHPNGANRISRLAKFYDDSQLFAQSGPSLAYDTGSQFTALVGPAVAAFLGATNNAQISYGEWRGHLFFASDEGHPIIKVYKDNGSTWRLIQAGLPPVDATQWSSSQSTAITNGCTLANDLSTIMQAHFTDTTTHTSASNPIHRASDTASSALITHGTATDLASLLALTADLLQAYQNHHQDSQASELHHYKEVTNTEWLNGYSDISLTADTIPSNASLASRTLITVAAPTDLVSCLSALNDLKKCFISHDSRVDIHGDFFNVGYHDVTTSFVYDIAQGPCAFLDRQNVYNLANNLKARYNGHLGHATGSYAHASADGVNTTSATNASTPETLQALIWSLTLKYTAHNEDAEKSSGWSFHYAKEHTPHAITPRAESTYTYPPYPDYFGGLRAGNWAEMITVLNSFKTRYNTHVNDGIAHSPNTSGAISNPYSLYGVDLTLATYLYAFYWSYTYTDSNGIIHTDVGPVYEMQASNVVAIEYQGLEVQNIPSLANSGSTNYPVSSIVMNVFRTTNGGTVFYRAATLANGLGTFVDRLADAQLVLGERIYTAGGEADHDLPPPSKCIHITNNTAYFGGITDSGQFFPNRVCQSINGIPSCAPGDFFDDLDDALVGISSVRTVPVAFCTHSIYRLEGGFDSTGAGAITHASVSDSVGLVSERSIVRLDSGLYFAGTDGFYVTDGYQITKLSQSWNTTYASLIATSAQAKRISGTYDPHTRRIWWAVQLNSTSTDNDGFVILDLNYPLSPSPCWTTASNPGHLSPTAGLFFNGNLVRGHSSGYIFKHVAGLTEDPYVNTSVTPANWGTKAILFDWKSCLVDFGLSNQRKWVPLIEWNCQDDTNLNLQINSTNDVTRAPSSLAPSYTHTHCLWGDETVIWGDKRLLWNFKGTLDKKRHFPNNTLRSTYKQIEFTNAFVTLQTSQDKGTCVIDAVAKTATLSNGSEHWPLDPEGAFLTVSYDGYVNPFEVTQKDSTTAPSVLTLSDPSNLLVSGTYSWKLKGYQKGQMLHLLDVTLWGKPIGLSQTGSRASS